jgi:hypothetical protein
MGTGSPALGQAARLLLSIKADDISLLQDSRMPTDPESVVSWICRFVYYRMRHTHPPTSPWSFLMALVGYHFFVLGEAVESTPSSNVGDWVAPTC